MKRETIISISDLPGAKTSTEEQRPVRPSKRAEDFPRRRLSGLINFYDLGQTQVDGEWVTTPWTKSPTITTGITGINYYISEIEDFTITDLKEFQDTLFDVPLEDWSTTYRKLEKEEIYKYGLDAYVTSDTEPIDLFFASDVPRHPLTDDADARFDMRWFRGLEGYDDASRNAVTAADAARMKAGGWKKPPGTYLEVPCYSGPFMGFEALYGQKVATERVDPITSLYDIELLELTGSADIYLMPAFYAISTTDAGPGTGFVYGMLGREVFNSTLLGFRSNALFDSELNPQGQNEHYLFTMSATPFIVIDRFVKIPDADIPAINDWLSSLPGKQQFTEGAGVSSVPDGDPVDSGGFLWLSPAYMAQVSLLGTGEAGFPGGIDYSNTWVLTAVIHQNGTWKYIYNYGINYRLARTSSDQRLPNFDIWPQSSSPF